MALRTTSGFGPLGEIRKGNNILVGQDSFRNMFVCDIRWSDYRNATKGMDCDQLLGQVFVSVADGIEFAGPLILSSHQDELYM